MGGGITLLSRVLLLEMNELYQMGTEVLRKQANLLHPINVSLAKCADLTMDAALELGNWAGAIQAGLLALPCYEYVFFVIRIFGQIVVLDCFIRNRIRT